MKNLTPTACATASTDREQRHREPSDALIDCTCLFSPVIKPMRDAAFARYSVGTIVLVSLSCYIEEWIFKQLPGFHFHWFVALVELLMFALLGHLGSSRVHGAGAKRKGPLLLYMGCGMSLAAGTGLGKVAFKYLNYATGTVLKSMKLLPVMALSVCWLRRSYGALEYGAALLMVGSAVCFGLGEAAVEPDFNPIGIALALACLMAQATQTNLQDRLLRDYDVSVHEAMLFANAAGCGVVLVVCIANGSLFPALRFFSTPLSAALLLARSLSFYAGALLYLLLKHAGGVAAVAVGTCASHSRCCLVRLLPKPWSGSYGWGSAPMLAAVPSISALTAVALTMRRPSGAPKGGWPAATRRMPGAGC